MSTHCELTVVRSFSGTIHEPTHCTCVCVVDLLTCEWFTLATLHLCATTDVYQAHKDHLYLDIELAPSDAPRTCRFVNCANVLQAKRPFILIIRFLSSGIVVCCLRFIRTMTMTMAHKMFILVSAYDVLT